jgi:hypothetical protein
MKIKFVCFCALLLSVINCFAQDESNTDVTNVTKAIFLGPGISHEKRIGKLQTVYLQAFMSTGFYFSSSSTFGTDAGITMNPALAAQYRYYYNAGRRQEKGKRTALNSMNYVGAAWETFFSKSAMFDDSVSEENIRPVHSFGLVWGFQRNYRSRFSLDFNIGYGYLFTKGTELNGPDEFHRVNQSGFTSMGDLSLGFWLNKRR